METQLGIVFTGGEGPTPQSIRRIFAGLHTGALIVAADCGLRLAEAAGLVPDWIIGDMDSLGGENGLAQYPGGRVVRHAAEKDHSDTELALSLLWEKGCGEAWIIGGGGGRIDHLLGIRDVFERERFPRRWITAGEDMRCIEGDGLEASVERGGMVSVFPLGGGPWKAESRGLKWPLGSVRWERGLYSLSNEATGESVAVIAGQGRFLVVLPGIV